jgi:hypothetical protein
MTKEKINTEEWILERERGMVRLSAGYERLIFVLLSLRQPV